MTGSETYNSRAIFRGPPPFAPFTRAARVLACEVAFPARRAEARRVTIPRYSGNISATEKSISSLGHTIVAPRSSTVTSSTPSPAARTLAEHGRHERERHMIVRVHPNNEAIDNDTQHSHNLTQPVGFFKMWPVTSRPGKKKKKTSHRERGLLFCPIAGCYKSSGLMPWGLYCVFGGGAATATSDS